MGTHEKNVHFKYRFLAEPYFVAVDEQTIPGADRRDSSRLLTAYFYDRRAHSGKLAENGQQVLGKFTRLKGVFCRENALIVLDGQTIHMFASKNSQGQKP